MMLQLPPLELCASELPWCDIKQKMDRVHVSVCFVCVDIHKMLCICMYVCVRAALLAKLSH